MTDDPQRVSRLLDSLLPTPPPPGDLVERILRAHARARPLRRRWVPPAALAVALAAAALILVVRPRPVPPGAGTLRAQVRQTVRIADRAVAVIEPQAEIAWRVQAGQLRIEQRRGEVFYRVEGGPPLTVASPTGEVVATGTCFRVAIRGPQGSAAAYVQVLEGALEVRNVAGSASLAAGHWARLSADRPPERLAATGPHAPSALEPGPGEEPPAAEPALVAVAPARMKSFAFTPAEHLSLARHCTFRWGLPRSLTRGDLAPPDGVALTPGERAAVARVIAEHRLAYLDDLRALHREVVGNDPDPSLSVDALFAAIDSHASRRDGRTARRKILAEWAGELPPPGDRGALPAIERFWRLEVAVLDDLAERLSPVLGPARARTVVERLTEIHVRGDEPGCPSGRPQGL
jgi:hypothetical protein